MFEDIDNLMNSVYGQFFGDKDKYVSYYPHVDIIENDSNFQLIADVPGLDVDDIIVLQQDGYISISSQTDPERLASKKRVYRMERNHKKFLRYFLIPQNVNVEAISAVLQNGTLNITLPKIQQQHGVKRIINIEKR